MTFGVEKIQRIQNGFVNLKNFSDSFTFFDCLNWKVLKREVDRHQYPYFQVLDIYKTKTRPLCSVHHFLRVFKFTLIFDEFTKNFE